MLAAAVIVGLAAVVALAAVVLRLRSGLRRERERVVALHAALESSIWEDRVRAVEQLEATVRELRQRGHEVNNVLSTALLSTQLFFDASHADEGSPRALAELGAAANGMVEALARLKDLLESRRRPETTASPSSSLIRSVELRDTVDECVARARVRFPGTALVVHGPDAAAPPLRVAVCAGRPALLRALGAVLENACQGDGVRAARRVEVRLGARREVDVVALEISDDGPGFTQTELGRPIAAFESTKGFALGLGLYTAERIARASGGSLRRANAESGGAIVSVFLPVASEPTLAQ